MREKITSSIFIAILVAFFVLVMVCPKDEQASVQENRPLAEMPEVSVQNILFGGFGPDYETYLTDNVGFRSKFVNLGTKIENIRGIQQTEKGRIVTLANGGQLALYDGKIMEVYKRNADLAQRYTNVLNAYADKFDANMYLMLAPTQIEFDDSKYHSLADSEKDTINSIYASLNDYKTADVYSKLDAHKGEYIYFRTDHHWTQKGAYYGYESIMEAKGATPVSINDMRVEKVSGFLGYLYNQANAPEYSEYADDIEYYDFGKNYSFTARSRDTEGNMIEYEAKVYRESGNTNPSYSMFMSGDHAFAEIDTDVKNGETALIIKDSYANTVIPFLTNHYEKILVVDPRSFDSTVTELVEEYEIDDIIFINYVLSTTFSDFIGFIEKMI